METIFFISPVFHTASEHSLSLRSRSAKMEKTNIIFVTWKFHTSLVSKYVFVHYVEHLHKQSYSLG